MARLQQRLQNATEERREYFLSEICDHLVTARAWARLETLFTDFAFLQAKAERDMTFDLAADFSKAADAIPADREMRSVLCLLQEAFRRDMHFISRHPTTLFQCLWNTCWWFDCPHAATHYEPPVEGWNWSEQPWNANGPKLHELMESWETIHQEELPVRPWLRCLRPPLNPLGGCYQADLSGHSDTVTAVTVSLDGSEIASGAKDGTVRVWDSRTGDVMGVCQDHDADVMCVGFSPDGQLLVSGSGDGTARIWAAKDGGQVAVFQHEKLASCDAELSCFQREPIVTAVAFSGDRRHIATATYEDAMFREHDGDRYAIIRVWDLKNRILVSSMKGHEDKIRFVAFIRDDAAIVSGSHDGTCRTWDAWTGKELASFLLLGECCENPYMTRPSLSVVSQLEPFQRVKVMAISVDAALVASSEKGTVWIWDLSTGEQVDRFLAPGYGLRTLAFSADGRYLASGQWADSLVKIWSIRERREIAAFDGHGQEVTTVHWMPNARAVVSGSEDTSLRVWSIERKTKVGRLRNHADRIFRLHFSPDGKRCVSASRDGAVYVWDVATGALASVLSGFKELAQDAKFSPDGRLVAGAGGKPPDCCIRIWDAENGVERFVLRGHRHIVTSVAFSGDGRQIVSGSWDNTVRLWDVYEKTELRCFANEENTVVDVALSADGRHVAVTDGMPSVWDVFSGARIQELRVFAQRIAFTPDCKRVITGDDKCIEVWELGSDQCVERVNGRRDVLDYATAGPERRWIARLDSTETVIENRRTGKGIAWMPIVLDTVATGPNGDTWVGASAHNVSIFRMECTNERLPPKHCAPCAKEDTRPLRPAGHVAPSTEVRQIYSIGRPIVSLRWSRDGRALAISSDDGIVEVLDKEGNRLWKQMEHCGVVWSVAWSPDGRRVASSAADSTVRIWDAFDGRQMNVVHDELPISAIAWSPDGRLIACKTNDGVRVVDACSGEEQGRIVAAGPSRVVCWSPKRNRIASVDDEHLQVWDFDATETVVLLDGHVSRIAHASWSPCGGFVASASADNTARVWNSESGACIATCLGHEGDLTWVSWFPDSKSIATASCDQTARIWSLPNGTEAWRSKELGTWVNSVEVAPDGSLLAIAAENGQVHFASVLTRD